MNRKTERPPAADLSIDIEAVSGARDERIPRVLYFVRLYTGLRLLLVNRSAQLDQPTHILADENGRLSGHEMLDSAWQYVVSQLKHSMGPGDFCAYIRDARVVGQDEDAVVVASPSELARDWCNSRLATIAARHLAPAVGRAVKVRFVYPGALQAEVSGALPGPARLKQTGPKGQQRHLPVDQNPAVVDTRDAPRQAGSLTLDPAAPWPEPMGNSAPGCLPGSPDDETGQVLLQTVADSIETALVRPGRIIAFPRYELRFIPLVGPENFFLRLAFLQERFFHTRDDGRDKPFETSVESLLRWANVGRATLHRFKKGDSARGQMPAAGWFGIEQMASAPRSAGAQQQPPCRFKIQAGIPLTPMDADRLRESLVGAGIQGDPLQALKTLCERPITELLEFPPPAPSDTLRGRAPAYNTVASVVKAALDGTRVSPAQRVEIDALTARLNDHITMPHQMVHVSWYFLQEWLPVLGHDAAAMVLYTRAQGFYNPQTHELRDEVNIQGGYSELAQAIGLKRDRTIGDWLPNLFESHPRRKETAPIPESQQAGAEDGKWAREQQRLAATQRNIGQFVQVVPGSRAKTTAGHFAFSLRVEIQGEPLTPADQALRSWVQAVLAQCAGAGVIEHFHAWVKSAAVAGLARGAQPQNDGAGILGERGAPTSIDGWGILAAASEYRQQRANPQMTAGESEALESDGWGILVGILNDSAGILGAAELTAGELFKGLLRLNTFWETILESYKTTRAVQKPERVVVEQWNLEVVFHQNGGMNAYREAVIAQPGVAIRFISWLLYACSPKGRGILDPVGWALSRVKEQPGASAGGAYHRLAAAAPEKLAGLLSRHIESGTAPTDSDWYAAFNEAPLARLRELEGILGL